MKKLTGLAAVAAMLFAAPVFACDKDKQATAATASGCHSKEAQTAAAKSGCHGEARVMAAKVMEKLPSMSYRVGDFNTPCPHAAAEKAGAEGKIQYLVDGKTYDCKGNATAALASLLEKQAADMMTMQYAVGEETFACPMAAMGKATQNNANVTYRLAGLDFKSREEAEKVARLVSDAVAKVANPEGPAPAVDPAPALAGGCNKANVEAASATGSGGCSKAKAETASAAGSGGCSKAKAETASATGGCGKAKAETASATGGCDKMKAAIASVSAGCGSKAKVETASASGCCSKGAAATASAGGCDKAKAQTASAVGCCSKEKAAVAGSPTCCDEAEKRLASAKAKLELIIETALASSNS